MISQAIIETILFICMLYGAIRFIKDISEGIVRIIFAIHSFNKERRLIRKRRDWEIIPDGGGTVEGTLMAAEIITRNLPKLPRKRDCVR